MLFAGAANETPPTVRRIPANASTNVEGVRVGTIAIVFADRGGSIDVPAGVKEAVLVGDGLRASAAGCRVSFERDPAGPAIARVGTSACRR